MLTRQGLASAALQEGHGRALDSGRLRSYERLAEAIGRPEPPDWNTGACRVIFLLGCVGASALLLLDFWVFTVGFTSGALGIFTLAGPVRFWWFWRQQRREWRRRQQLLRAVAHEPGFLEFYQGAPPYDLGLKGGREETARMIGRPRPPSWREVRIGAWFVVVLGMAALCLPLWPVVFGPLPAPSGEPPGDPLAGLLAVDLLVLVVLGWWIVRCTDLMAREQREGERSMLLVNAMAADPGFLEFYERWARTAKGSDEKRATDWQDWVSNIQQ